MELSTVLGAPTDVPASDAPDPVQPRTADAPEAPERFLGRARPTEDRDLAANLPGQSALAKADLLRAEEVARWRAAVDDEHGRALVRWHAAAAEHARLQHRHETRVALRRRTWWGRLLLRLAPPAAPPPPGMPPRPAADPPATVSDLPWRIAAEGEQEVARLLRELEPGWRTLHAVPVGRRGADLDHVALGPGGAVVVSTKNLRGRTVWSAGRTVTVDGCEQDYVACSRLELHRLQHALARAGCPAVPARALLAVVDATAVRHGGTAPPDGIHVVAAEDLVDRLRALPVVLSADEVSALYERLRRSSAWR